MVFCGCVKSVEIRSEERGGFFFGWPQIETWVRPMQPRFYDFLDSYAIFVAIHFPSPHPNHHLILPIHVLHLPVVPPWRGGRHVADRARTARAWGRERTACYAGEAPRAKPHFCSTRATLPVAPRSQSAPLTARGDLVWVDSVWLYAG